MVACLVVLHRSLESAFAASIKARLTRYRITGKLSPLIMIKLLIKQEVRTAKKFNKLHVVVHITSDRLHWLLTLSKSIKCYKCEIFTETKLFLVKYPIINSPVVTFIFLFYVYLLRRF